VAVEGEEDSGEKLYVAALEEGARKWSGTARRLPCWRMVSTRRGRCGIFGVCAERQGSEEMVPSGRPPVVDPKAGSPRRRERRKRIRGGAGEDARNAR